MMFLPLVCVRCGVPRRGFYGFHGLPSGFTEFANGEVLAQSHCHVEVRVAAAGLWLCGVPCCLRGLGIVLRKQIQCIGLVGAVGVVCHFLIDAVSSCAQQDQGEQQRERRGHEGRHPMPVIAEHEYRDNANARHEHAELAQCMEGILTVWVIGGGHGRLLNTYSNTHSLFGGRLIRIRQRACPNRGDALHLDWAPSIGLRFANSN
ncbi:hypothetical protein A4U98_07450 [Bifidobacterium animalis subsp. animalis]|nr:hypothetical protein A4U98_07450 [Bifidobacterium animalis subsp. animalis]PHQ54833.1 hypothetical protein ADH71_003460 [Bifidobacterium animalis subsp. animalis]